MIPRFPFTVTVAYLNGQRAITKSFDTMETANAAAQEHVGKQGVASVTVTLILSHRLGQYRPHC